MNNNVLKSTMGSCVDITDFKCTSFCNLRVFNEGQQFNGSTSLVVSSNRYGITFVAYPNHLCLIFMNDVRQLVGDFGIEKNTLSNFLRREIELNHVPNFLDLSCDEDYLAVAGTINFKPLIQIYHIETLISQSQVTPLVCIDIESTQYSHVVDMLWNPGVQNSLACCLSDGSLHVIELKTDQSYSIVNLPPQSNTLCLSWSPKGKQIIIGSLNGSLTQYKPELKAVKQYSPPSDIAASVKPIKVKWISNFQFAVVYDLKDNSDDQPSLYIVNTPKNAPVEFINFEQFVIMNSEQYRINQYYTIFQQNWNLLFVASSNCTEIGVMGTNNDGHWQCWTLEMRPELPYRLDKQMYPLGISLDLSSQTRIKQISKSNEETFLNPMPVLCVLSSDGVLFMYHIENQLPNYQNICKAAMEIPDNVVSQLFLTTSNAKVIQNNDQEINKVEVTVKKELQNDNESANKVGDHNESILATYLETSTSSQLDQIDIISSVKTSAINSHVAVTSSATIAPSQTIKNQSIPTDNNESPDCISINASTNEILLKEVMEDVGLFQCQLENALKLSSNCQKLKIGDDKDKETLVKKWTSLDLFFKELNETNRSQWAETKALQKAVLDATAWVEDSKSRLFFLKNPKYKCLLRNDNDEPFSKIVFDNIERTLYYIETQLTHVDDQLQSRYDFYSSNTKELKIPRLETIYKSLVVNTNIVNKLKEKINCLCDDVEEVKHKTYKKLSLAPDVVQNTSRLNDSRDTGLSKLSEQLLKITLDKDGLSAINSYNVAKKYSVLSANQRALSNAKVNKLQEWLKDFKTRRTKNKSKYAFLTCYNMIENKWLIKNKPDLTINTKPLTFSNTQQTSVATISSQPLNSENKCANMVDSFSSISNVPIVKVNAITTTMSLKTTNISTTSTMFSISNNATSTPSIVNTSKSSNTLPMFDKKTSTDIKTTPCMSTASTVFGGSMNTSTAPFSFNTSASANTFAMFGNISNELGTTAPATFCASKNMTSGTSIFNSSKTTNTSSAVFDNSTSIASGTTTSTSTIFGFSKINTTGTSSIFNTSKTANTPVIFGGMTGASNGTNAKSFTASTIFGLSTNSTSTPSIFNTTKTSVSPVIFGNTTSTNNVISINSVTTSTIFSPAASTSSAPLIFNTIKSTSTPTIFGSTTSAVDVGSTTNSLSTSNIFGSPASTTPSSSSIFNTAKTTGTPIIFGKATSTDDTYTSTQPLIFSNTEQNSVVIISEPSTPENECPPAIDLTSVSSVPIVEITDTETTTSTTTSTIFGSSKNTSVFNTSDVVGSTTSTLFGPTTSLTTASTIFGGDSKIMSNTPSIFNTSVNTSSSSIFGNTTSTVNSCTTSSLTTSTIFGSSVNTTSAPSNFNTSQSTSTLAVFSTSTNTNFETATNLSTTSTIFGTPKNTSGMEIRKTSSIFGSPSTTTAAASSGLFGSVAAAANQSSSFGQPTLGFSSPESALNSSSLGFGAPPVFGSSTFSNPSGFGQAPVFGGAATFGSNASSQFNTFGQSTNLPESGTFGFGAATQQPSTAFASLAAQNNTPAFGNLPQNQNTGFSSVSTFGQQQPGSNFSSPSAFGQAPVFGGAATFGSTAPSQYTFGQTTSLPESGTFGFASAAQQPSTAFASLAAQNNTSAFGNLPQNQSSGFASPSSTTFGQSQQQQTSPFKPQGAHFGGSSFSSWR
ncbi:nuclear pore complex protein Nup214 [Adelges cooleyi]|uniref:nuclear pore complex protein Nup214 n=1 Tax=Adelges cooleyi TaxID=133065 RepID=UPI00217F5797|nr:nuclear pore complex protein Nup214 [Adelges cooleyi]